MTTAVILLLLCGPWVAAVLLRWDAATRQSFAVAGIALVFVFTGVGHFILTEAMVRMIPDWFPERRLLILVSGVVEIAAGGAVLVPRYRRPLGWFIIAMLVGLLPFNVYAAIHRVPMGGHAWGPAYLWIRVPLQVVLIGWTWWFAARARRSPDPSRSA